MATQIDVTLRLIDMMTAPLVRVQNEMERTARAHQRMGRDIQRIGDGFSSVGEKYVTNCSWNYSNWCSRRSCIY